MSKKIIFVLLLFCCILALASCSGECRHFYMSETVYPPDCSNEGKTLNQCLDCTFSFYSDYTEPLGHTLKESSVDPTCTEAGYTLYSCDCGYSYQSEFTPPKNHVFVSTVVESKCEESGYTVYFCNCGYSYRADFTPPTNHAYYVTLETKATCTTAGSVEHTCKTCGDKYTDSVVAPFGHSITTETIRPTCLAGGHKLNTCETCGYSYKSDYIFYSDIVESAFTGSTSVIAKGLDISKWNHNLNNDGTYAPLDWKLIKSQGFEFTILKIGSTLRNGETSGGLEPTFEADYASAKAAGFDVGAYFYTYAHSVEEIRKDAYDLLGYLKGKKFQYPIYLDMEENSQMSLGKNLLGEMCAEFISILQSEGYYAGVYLNNLWLVGAFDTVEMTSYFDLWYARYPNSSSTPVWNEEEYGEQLGMWQFTQTGTIVGIVNYKNKPIEFCFDYAYRDYPSLIKKWHLNGY